MSKIKNDLFGLSATFDDAHDLLEATKKAKAAGYNDIKAYSPYEVHGISEVIGESSPLLGWLVLIGILAGIAGAFAVQYWTSAIHYPLIVGNKPLNPWPAFIPVMFEAAILFGGLTAAIFMFVRSGLPLPYHPIFNIEAGSSITTDSFVLCIMVSDDQFDMDKTEAFLTSLDPIQVSEVTS